MTESWRQQQDKKFTQELFILDKFLIVFGMLHRDAHLVHRHVDEDHDDAEVDRQPAVMKYILDSRMDFQDVTRDLKYVLSQASSALGYTPQALASGNKAAVAGPSGLVHSGSAHPQRRHPPPSPADSPPAKLTRLRKRGSTPDLGGTSGQGNRRRPTRTTTDPSSPSHMSTPSFAPPVPSDLLERRQSRDGERLVTPAPRERLQPKPRVVSRITPGKRQQQSSVSNTPRNQHSAPPRRPIGLSQVPQALSSRRSQTASSLWDLDLPPLPSPRAEMPGQSGKDVADEHTERSTTPARWSLSPPNRSPSPSGVIAPLPPQRHQSPAPRTRTLTPRTKTPAPQSPTPEPQDSPAVSPHAEPTELAEPAVLAEPAEPAEPAHPVAGGGRKRAPQQSAAAPLKVLYLLWFTCLSVY